MAEGSVSNIYIRSTRRIGARHTSVLIEYSNCKQYLQLLTNSLRQGPLSVSLVSLFVPSYYFWYIRRSDRRLTQIVSKSVGSYLTISLCTIYIIQYDTAFFLSSSTYIPTYIKVIKYNTYLFYVRVLRASLAGNRFFKLLKITKCLANK